MVILSSFLIVTVIMNTNLTYTMSMSPQCSSCLSMRWIFSLVWFYFRGQRWFCARRCWFFFSHLRVQRLIFSKKNLLQGKPREKKKTFNVTDTNSDRFLLFLRLPKGQQISLLHPAGRVKRFVIQWTLPLTRAAFQSVNDLSWIFSGCLCVFGHRLWMILFLPLIYLPRGFKWW